MVKLCWDYAQYSQTTLQLLSGSQTQDFTFQNTTANCSSRLESQWRMPGKAEKEEEEEVVDVMEVVVEGVTREEPGVVEF